ncbi:molybdopterin-containing oxidoreductase family protein [Desulfosudis oleivorans]|uniref:Molybdopterin oxidoreductase n=1 Tax=Desulfosudis oleivorans (strain DSM 6200 / JCM 39069 / Hxd3) TaxID=96561 RepID=A8ZSV9_DESOH|nr:molybdopterin-dependent oxidoreductase [Desulfosudis oleivorans]ABW66123.1 molybdopterin oxidoreductase [Desulfosudis oleivorans Hxd3]
MATTKVKTICFECHSRCGLVLEVEGGRVTAVHGDKDHPHSHGYSCPKGRACMEIIYHPDRITTPLIKVGERQGTRFEKASWDDALGLVAERLLASREQWGAESVVFGSGTTRGMAPYINRFLALFGSPNFMAPSNMSGGPLALGSATTTGFGLVDPDYANTRCMLLWAHNPENSWPGLYLYDINQGLKKGATLIVVDPRGTRFAKKADHWLRLRPGTDVALVLSFIHVIIENGLYDKAFVEQWTSGFDRLREYVADFAPEKVESITWVPAGQIKTAATVFATARPSVVGPGMGGVCQANDAFDLTRGLTILAAITGNLEVPGGNLNCTPPTRKRSCYGSDYDAPRNLPPDQAAKKLGADTYPLFGLVPIPCPPQAVWPAITDGKPYPVRALGLFANNSVCAYPHSARVRSVLQRLDFLFCVDYFHTPTTELADVILPPAHWSERDDVEDLLMKNHLFCQPKAVEPVPECRDEKEILIGLAQKMGLTEYWKSVTEILDYRLEPVSMTFAEFKKTGVFANPVEYKRYEKTGRFRTPSGKVELYAEYLTGLGIAPLPVFREPDEGPVSRPDLYREYPLILTTGGRNIVYYHSSHRNIPSLRKKAPDPELQIHPDTAADLGVSEGEWVYLATPRAKVEIKIRLFADIDPRVVHAPHGFWYGVADGWRRLNINMVTNDEPLCPVTASVPIKSLLCRLEKMAPR